MSTLYDLFKVKENATQEQIREAYESILQKAASLPQNEKIVDQVRKIKIAYGILSDSEKRKKYDLDLATQRADELLQKVQPRKEELAENKLKEPVQTSETPNIPINEEKIKQEIESQINHAIQYQNIRDLKQKLDKQREQKQLTQQQWKKEVQKQERKKKRQAKKEQQLKREMEINAYGEYLQRQGYKVKYPWTWLRIKRLILSITAVLITLFILWQIPFVRKTLTDLYNQNFVIKFLADIVFSIFNGIINGIKSIFKQ